MLAHLTIALLATLQGLAAAWGGSTDNVAGAALRFALASAAMAALLVLGRAALAAAMVG